LLLNNVKTYDVKKPTAKVGFYYAVSFYTTDIAFFRRFSKISITMAFNISRADPLHG
jgi:hypothetical protein